jgi:mycothiol synthase
MTSNSGFTASSDTWSFRQYESERDLQQMHDMLMEARERTSDWRYPHIGEMLWNFFMVDCHLKPGEFIRIWHDLSGKLIAYAILGEDPSFDCQVLPEYEWTGIEEQALTWVEARLSELRKFDSKTWGGKLVSGARQDDANRLAFLEQHGFKYSGEFAEVNMIRSLGIPIPDTSLPSGFRVCAFTEIHEHINSAVIINRAGIQREVWHPWTVGNVTDKDYLRFMNLPGYRRDLDIVAIAPKGVIASYLNGWIDPINRIGDFGPVGARPAYRRQGLTRAVLLEGMRRMKMLGMERVCISTGETNTPALRLYESIGFKIVNKYLDYVR